MNVMIENSFLMYCDYHEYSSQCFCIFALRIRFNLKKKKTNFGCTCCVFVCFVFVLLLSQWCKLLGTCLVADSYVKHINSYYIIDVTILLLREFSVAEKRHLQFVS